MIEPAPDLPVETTAEVPYGAGTIPDPVELLRKVSQLVDVIHERNAIEKHRDEVIEKWAGRIADSWVARIVGSVMLVRALFGVDVPTFVGWIQAVQSVQGGT